MIIYLYPEHGHEPLAIDLEELDKQIAWLHEQPMCDENEGIWNLLESIRDLGESLTETVREQEMSASEALPTAIQTERQTE